MPRPDLIDSLPDLVLLVKRDGTPVAHAGGRAVTELGFIGCNLNPDPSGGFWTSPPLTDRSWYPCYEAMVELYDKHAAVDIVQLNQLLARFDRMVQQECETNQAGEFLIQRLTDALALENGNFHSGLKLNPRTPGK